VGAHVLFREISVPRAPRGPFQVSEHAGPNGPESQILASSGWALGIRTSGMPNWNANN